MDSAEVSSGGSLLACLALSPRVQAVAREAHLLSARLGKTVEFVHAGPDTPETRESMAGALRSLSINPEKARLHIRDEKPARAICDVARETNISMVVAGAMEKEGVFEGIVGSVARQIARKAPCSVMLLPDPKPLGSSFRRIVVSIKYDAVSREMVELAATLARMEAPNELHLVRECQYYGAGSASSTMSSRDEESEKQWQAADFIELRDFASTINLKGVDLELHCIEGREGSASVEFAQRIDADLLIIAAPPRLTIWDRFFNHPSEHALDHLPCALLLFRVEQDPDSEEES